MTKDEAPTYFTDKHAQSMTLRDHFAGLAMQALIDNEVVFADVPPVTGLPYTIGLVVS